MFGIYFQFIKPTLCSALILLIKGRLFQDHTCLSSQDILPISFSYVYLPKNDEICWKTPQVCLSFLSGGVVLSWWNSILRTLLNKFALVRNNTQLIWLFPNRFLYRHKIIKMPRRPKRLRMLFGKSDSVRASTDNVMESGNDQPGKFHIQQATALDEEKAFSSTCDGLIQESCTQSSPTGWYSCQF